ALRERRLVGGGDDDGLDARGLGCPQDVPRAVQVRVDELLRKDLGPVDMLVRGEVEDNVRLRGGELLLEPPRLADVAEDVPEEVERLRVAGAPVGDQRGLVPVDDRDPLRPEAAEERRKRAADRAAAAGEQDPAAAEPLLQLEHGWNRIATLENLLPVERVRRHTAADRLRLRRRQRERP